MRRMIAAQQEHPRSVAKRFGDRRNVLIGNPRRKLKIHAPMREPVNGAQMREDESQFLLL
jgi:hypothetical protein